MGRKGEGGFKGGNGRVKNHRSLVLYRTVTDKNASRTISKLAKINVLFMAGSAYNGAEHFYCCTLTTRYK